MNGGQRDGADVQGGYRIWNAWVYNNGGETIAAAICRGIEPYLAEQRK